ncbi:retropepsin-like aspartic protease family protein [Croceicoccus mobilis]|uniref:Membrane protein n=1 Tax=Croceicoccus mobilis TaxID=1703339 RepID=A0A916YT83_9SPHN|nr:TIGR02281 family clan AA aspartic protease [Croceicoccus mobilis]GGD58957.1 membrane protein [Croceicoccus mobilis]
MSEMHKIFWGVFGLCAVGAVVTGMSDNGDNAADMPPTPVGEALALSGPVPSASGDMHGGAIRLRREVDGHFYASPSIEGAQMNVLVDTGASFVALTGEDARAAGLYWSESDVRPIARGASGVVEGVPMMIDRIELNGTEIRDVEAAVIPEGLSVTLLGQSFLQRFDKVAIEGDTMVLSQD